MAKNRVEPNEMARLVAEKDKIHSANTENVLVSNMYGNPTCAETANTVESLYDRLKSKKNQLLAKIRQLDRQMSMLENSNAEDIVKEAERTLYSE